MKNASICVLLLFLVQEMGNFNTNILLVDDKQKNLDYLKTVLAYENRVFYEAKTAEEGLEILKKTTISILITDVDMPGMTGFDLLNQISGRPEFAELYTIFVLRKENLEKNIVYGLNNGAVDYLIKPYHPEITQAKVSIFEKLSLKKRILEQERQRSLDLLLNILPKQTAEELTSTGSSKARFFSQATVMFADFVEFTKISTDMNPEILLEKLNRYFTAFDYISQDHFLEKIKTIGDAYMCVGGIPIRNKFHAVHSVLAAFKINHYVNQVIEENKHHNEALWKIRIGIHTGPLVAGVVGKLKWQYDVWGDTVNTANRVQSTCEPGKINISGTTYELVKEYFDCEYRGELAAKHKGFVHMYYVDGIKEKYRSKDDFSEPNEFFYKIIKES